MRNFLSKALGGARSESGIALVAWLPWVALIVVGGVVGATVGIAGVLGHPTTLRTVVASDASVARTATAYSCPGGPAIDSLDAGDRVLTLERSKDFSYLAVRDPLNLGRLLWFRAADVSVDSRQAAIATLPVGSCPDVSGILMPPTNQGDTTPVAPPAPTAPTAPTKPVTPPAPDTTPPTLGTPTAGTPIVCTRIGDPPYTDTISVTASDNVGVTSVAISWSGATNGSGTMTHSSGSTWTYVYDVGNSNAGGTVTFQIQAKDAAGNPSSPTKVSVTQGGCVG